MFGAYHVQTTSYHPQSNGMIERFHRHMKASLMAQSNENDQWMSSLPLIMLNIRAAVKEDLKMSCAEILYGESIQIPGAFFSGDKQTSDFNIYIQDLKDKMRSLNFVSPNWHGNLGENQISEEFKSCSHVYLLVSAVKKPLQRPYVGPFKVISKGAKAFEILLDDGRSDFVSIDRLKPARVIP